jgi:hypothetical protein
MDVKFDVQDAKFGIIPYQIWHQERQVWHQGRQVWRIWRKLRLIFNFQGSILYICFDELNFISVLLRNEESHYESHLIEQLM